MFANIKERSNKLLRKFRNLLSKHPLRCKEMKIITFPFFSLHAYTQKSSSKERRKYRSSDSPTTTSHVSPSGTPPPSHLDGPHIKHLESTPTAYLHHNHNPSAGEDILPTGTSSSVQSLFVPTTDSGISIPMVSLSNQFDPWPSG